MLDLVRNHGDDKSDRTGTGTRSIFGLQARYNLSEGFPAVTTKKLYMRSIIHELLWFLSGSGNIKYLVDNDVSIWNEWPYKHYLTSNGNPVPNSDSDEWRHGMANFIEKIKTDNEFAKKWGELGPVYGVQWRHWPDGKGGEIDQIKRAIDTIKTNPDSRRNIVSAWNVAEIEEMAKAGLPPCHTLFQFNVRGDYLDLQLYQRSADMFLGVPFNIASYALLLCMVAQVTGKKPGHFVHSLGDAHIYSNHFTQVDEQLSREPFALPTLWLNPNVTAIDEFTFSDIRLENYQSHGALKAPIAV